MSESGYITSQGLKLYFEDANVEDVEQLRKALQLRPCMIFGHSYRSIFTIRGGRSA